MTTHDDPFEYIMDLPKWTKFLRDLFGDISTLGICVKYDKLSSELTNNSFCSVRASNHLSPPRTIYLRSIHAPSICHRRNIFSHFAIQLNESFLMGSTHTSVITDTTYASWTICRMHATQRFPILTCSNHQVQEISVASVIKRYVSSDSVYAWRMVVTGKYETPVRRFHDFHSQVGH